MQLILWTAFCALAALAGRRAPVHLLGGILLLRLAVPSTAGTVLFGDWQAAVAIHPATILLGFAAPLIILERRQEFGLELRSQPLRYYALLCFIAVYLTLTIIASGPAGAAGLVNVVIGPIVFFLLIRIVARVNDDYLAVLVRWFLVFCGLSAILGILQVVMQQSLLWSGYYPRLYLRATGTFDSPLDLAYVLAVATPLLAALRSSWIRFGMLILFGAGIASSESRAPMAAFILATLVLICRRGIPNYERVIGFIAFILMGFVIWFSGLLSRLLYRFQVDDGNSSAARSIAFDYARTYLPDHTFTGDGWGSTFDIRGSVIRTSLESGYLAIAFDVGIVFAVFYLLIQLSIARGAFCPFSQEWPFACAGLIAVGLAGAYSGIVTMSAAATVQWFALALATGIGSNKDAHDRRQVQRVVRFSRGLDECSSGSQRTRATGKVRGNVSRNTYYRVGRD